MIDEREKLPQEFKDMYGISDEEEEFFNYLYKRECKLRAIIAVLISVALSPLLWKLLLKPLLGI